jgi:predicted transcriptional regulator
MRTSRPKPDDRYLSKREQQIMELFHQRDRLTAAEITELLPGNPAKATNSTVRTLLRILEKKKKLRHVEERGRFVYMPVGSRQAWARSALRGVAKSFFRGSIADVVVALVDDGGRLSDEELARLQAAIDRARAARR